MRRGTPRSWLKNHVKPVAPSRDVEKDFALEAKRFQELAPVLGWCGHCGATVNEAKGILHAYDCPYLPASRRKPVGDP